MNKKIIFLILTVSALIGLDVSSHIYAQSLDIKLAKVYQGETAGDSFGFGIGAAGDLNGDGYDDFLIGARFWGPGELIYVRAYVYLGGDTLPDEPALILSNGSSDQIFGYELSGVGDLNNDGYDDYAISSGGFGDAIGAVNIFFGGDTLSSNAELVLRGAFATERFGVSIAGGDLNNDGYSDLIVGAPFSSPIIPGLGRVYVYYGSDTFDAEQDWVTFAVNDSFRYGITVDIGDLNGDGIDDLAIGSVNTDSDSGNYHIFFGGNIFDTNEDVTIVSSKGSIGFIVMMGNLNGDAADEIVVWDFFDKSQKIYFGGTEFDSIPDDEIKTDELCGDIGNFDGDGFDDLIIGHPIRNIIRIFRGSNQFDHTSDFSFQLGGFSTGFGCAESIGDVNGDGAGDFIVPDLLGGTIFFEEGLAYIFLGDNSAIVSVDPEPEDVLPRSLTLYQNYPNPFNPETVIEFVLPVQSDVNLIIYNLRGEEVAQLIDQNMQSGKHSVSWDASRFASGMYFYRLTSRQTDGGQALLQRLRRWCC